jgi:hypothetical protein
MPHRNRARAIDGENGSKSTGGNHLMEEVVRNQS